MNALRLAEGFEIGLFGERTGLEWAAVSANLERLAARRLLVIEGSMCQPTPWACVSSTKCWCRFYPKVLVWPVNKLCQRGPDPCFDPRRRVFITQPPVHYPANEQITVEIS